MPKSPGPNLSIGFCCSFNSTHRTVLGIKQQQKTCLCACRDRGIGAMEEREIQSWYMKILCHPMEFQELFHLLDAPTKEHK